MSHGTRAGKIVLGGLMLLAAVVIFMAAMNFGDSPENSDDPSQSVTVIRFRQLRTALDTYRLDVGEYPQTNDGLDALQEDPGVDGWAGPYIRDRSLLRDEWRRPLRYLRVQSDFELLSSGPDGLFDTCDDMHYGRVSSRFHPTAAGT